MPIVELTAPRTDQAPAGDVALALQRGARLEDVENVLRLVYSLEIYGRSSLTILEAVERLDHVIQAYREGVAQHGDEPLALIWAAQTLGLEE